MAPRLCSGDRSPQLTVTWRTGLGLLAAAAMTNVKAAGKPALMVAGGVMVSVGEPATPTVTLAEAVPVADGVGVAGLPPPPVVGGVAGAVAPTLAVTTACVDVFSTTCAAPLLSVTASVELNTPAVVENDTGAAASTL